MSAGERTAVCPVCAHHCRLTADRPKTARTEFLDRLPEGQAGRCRARKMQDGAVIPVNYGYLTALALDPIEKKPLYHFHPGRPILSVGSFGCNMACPFCQNYGISQAGMGQGHALRRMSPEELCETALTLKRERGNIGVAYTYNEPLVGYEYVRDAAKAVRAAGMENVLVTNGQASGEILEELLPFVDAMNIDLKGFHEDIYRRLGGDLETTKTFIRTAGKGCHIEITSLIVPGFNDKIEDMNRQAAWIAGISPDIPLHITRYFPQYRMTDVPPTDKQLLHELADIAREHLQYVYVGNV